MNIPTDSEFDQLISRAMDDLPKRDIENLQNVVVTYADEPNGHQTQKLSLRRDSLLLGLYEGIPLTQRGAGYNLVLPDKITIFKLPIVKYCQITGTDLYEQIRHTLWHEIAHFYGLNHTEIHRREN
ncbi:MAG: metallopeptidase family protein [Candidatus Saccharibacteria bacterium]|nr:metallopeptidase family protein [Candidatus Saccharibacteria bacterium]